MDGEADTVALLAGIRSGERMRWGLKFWGVGRGNGALGEVNGSTQEPRRISRRDGWGCRAGG